jgi:hypothetical protein
MKPKTISELLVHFQGYLDMFDTDQDYNTKARLYLESLNMDIGSCFTDMPSKRFEQIKGGSYDVTPEFYFIYRDNATMAELYRVNDLKPTDNIQVIASDNKALSHEYIRSYFLNAINSGAYKKS